MAALFITTAYFKGNNSGTYQTKWQAGMIASAEVNMDSNPRTLTFFAGDTQLNITWTNIPAQIQFAVCYIP